jgi:hypothetical protein
MNGVDLIAKERQRQVDVHDDRHTSDQLIRAALCYATPPSFRDETPMREGLDGWESCPIREAQYTCPELWPFPPNEWTPSPGNRVRELAIAGSLIAAEIDRLLRKGPA